MGTWQWMLETNGCLTRAQRFELFPALLDSFGAFCADRFRLALGKSPRHGLSAEDLWPTAPDSKLSRQADEEARDLQSAPMLHHGYRTWIFGAALARIDGAPIDPELFHTGALLHDVGLEDVRVGRCFTRRSAEAAQAVAQRSQLGADRTSHMMTGIIMHITPGLEYDDSPLGFYLQAGAMADLVGIRAWELPLALRNRTHETYPRAEVHQVLSSCWQAEAKAVPGGRAHFADAYGAFSRIVRWFPLR